MFRKLVLGDSLLTLLLAGLDKPLAARKEGERASPSALVIEEFCRFEPGGRGELGGLDDLEDVGFGGGGLLLMLVMIVEIIDSKRSPWIHFRI